MKKKVTYASVQKIEVTLEMTDLIKAAREAGEVPADFYGEAYISGPDYDAMPERPGFVTVEFSRTKATDALPQEGDHGK